MNEKSTWLPFILLISGYLLHKILPEPYSFMALFLLGISSLIVSVLEIIKSAKRDN